MRGDPSWGARQVATRLLSYLPPAQRYWLKGSLLEILRRAGVRRFGEPQGMPGRVPSHVVTQIEALRGFAPELVAADILPRARVVQPRWTTSAGSEAWRRLAAEVIPGADFLIIADSPVDVPRVWLEQPGATLVCTGDSSGPGPDALPRIPFGRHCGSLPLAMQGILLSRLLIELRVPAVGVATSGAGLAALEAVAGALVSSSEVSVLLQPPGETDGQLERLLSSPFPSRLIFAAESEATLSYWRLRFGIDRTRCLLLTGSRSRE